MMWKIPLSASTSVVSTLASSFMKARSEASTTDLTIDPCRVFSSPHVSNALPFTTPSTTWYLRTLASFSLSAYEGVRVCSESENYRKGIL